MLHVLVDSVTKTMKFLKVFLLNKELKIWLQVKSMGCVV